MPPSKSVVVLGVGAPWKNVVKGTFLSPTQTTIAGVFVTPEMHQIRSTHPIYWSIKNKLQNSRAELSPNNIFPRQIKRLSSFYPLKSNRLLLWSECIKGDSSMIAQALKLPNTFFLFRRDLGQNYRILFHDYHLALEIWDSAQLPHSLLKKVVLLSKPGLAWNW